MSVRKSGIGVAAIVVALVGSCLLVLSAPTGAGVGTIATLTPHDPIAINGNGNFTSAKGVVSGLGTQADPYIISDWYIDAQGAEYAIKITNADAFAVVRNCVLYNATGESTYWGWYGNDIEIDHVKNLIVENCSISVAYTAFYMANSEQNIVRNNTMHDTDHMGLQLYQNDTHNLVENNNIFNISYNGICLWLGSNNNTVRENWVHSNTFSGINVMSSSGNLVSENLLEDNQAGVEVYVYSDVYDMVISGNTIRSSNTGIRILGEHNTVSGNLIQNCSWGVNLYMANYTTVSGNTIENVSVGVWGQGSNDSIIYGNHIHGCFDYGIELESSNRWYVNANTVENCSWYAVYLDEFSSDSVLFGNNFWYNDGSGDAFDSSYVQASDDGTNNAWDLNLQGNFWSDWRTPDLDSDGIVDHPYPVDGTANAQDDYPLTTISTPIPEFTMMSLVAVAFTAVIVLAGETRRKGRS